MDSGPILASGAHTKLPVESLRGAKPNQKPKTGKKYPKPNSPCATPKPKTGKTYPKPSSPCAKPNQTCGCTTRLHQVTSTARQPYLPGRLGHGLNLLSHTICRPWKRLDRRLGAPGGRCMLAAMQHLRACNYFSASSYVRASMWPVLITLMKLHARLNVI